jgi:NADPH:quinone reductase
MKIFTKTVPLKINYIREPTQIQMKDTIPANMKALFPINPEGDLSLKTVPVPQPAKGEVLIRILAAPVNPSDLGRIRTTPVHEYSTFIPGIEGCGVVVKAGKGILPGFWLGKRVACTFTHSSSGTWAEYMVTSAARCFPLPKKISNEQASMLFVNPLTAVAFIDLIRKDKHRTIINLAAASALGRMIRHLGKEKGIRIINLVRRTNQVEELREQGAEIVLNSSDNGFEELLNEQIKLLQPTLLLDPVGGKQTESLLEKMPYGSKVILYGTLSGEDFVMNPRILISGNKQIAGFFLGAWLPMQGLPKTMRMLIQARNLLTKGPEVQVRTKIGLEEVANEIPKYLGNMSAGKVIICPGK